MTLQQMKKKIKLQKDKIQVILIFIFKSSFKNYEFYTIFNKKIGRFLRSDIIIINNLSY